MRFSCFRVSAAVSVFLGAIGCAADSKPEPSSPTTVNVEPVPPPDEPPITEVEPTDEREVEDDVCHELSAAIPSSNANTVLVFMRASGPVCVGSSAAADDAALENAAKEAADRGVTAAVLYADASVVYARMIAVMDVLRRAGIGHVSLAVRQGR